MKKKCREILLTMAAFGVLTYLGHHTYLLEWLAERYFCFIWMPILVLWLFRQDILARWLSLGAFGGLFLGQLAEEVKWSIWGVENQAAHSSYWGVAIWFGAVLLALAAGLVHCRLQKGKASKANSFAI